MKIFKIIVILRRNNTQLYFKICENFNFENHSHFHPNGAFLPRARQNPNKTALFALFVHMWCADTVFASGGDEKKTGA